MPQPELLTSEPKVRDPTSGAGATLLLTSAEGAPSRAGAARDLTYVQSMEKRGK